MQKKAEENNKKISSFHGKKIFNERTTGKGKNKNVR